MNLKLLLTALVMMTMTVSCTLYSARAPTRIKIVNSGGIPVEGVRVAATTFSSKPQVSDIKGEVATLERFIVLVKEGYLEKLVDTEADGLVMLEKEALPRTPGQRAANVGILNEKKRALMYSAYYE